MLPPVTPEVSVVIPAYNASRHIFEAVSSILDQTFRNLEVVIVNDGSTDETRAICDSLAAKDRRIVVITQDNKGVSGALNAGIRLSRGPLIARMDADDIAFPERIEKQLEVLCDSPDTGLVSAGYIPFAEMSLPTLAPIVHPSGHQCIYALLAFCSPICHPAVLARRELFQQFPYRPGVAAEDHDLWCRAIHSYQFANIEAPLLYYRRHAASITANKMRRLKLSTARSGVTHITRDLRAYRKACDQCRAVDRARYSSINWKWLDRINATLLIHN